MSAPEREWRLVGRDEDPELYARLAGLAMELGGPNAGGMELCALLMQGEAVPLDRLNPEAVARYGLRAPATNGRVTLGDFHLVPFRDPASAEDDDGWRPFALPLDEFRSELDEAHTPLLGNDAATIIPSEGLVVVAGQPGVGKTTVVLDLVLSLASGVEWLGMDVPRPLNVLLVENEGPQPMFRAKLDRKASSWPHERVGEVWVQTWRWGLFSLSDQDARAQLRMFCAEQPVDVIVGDPLGSLGPAGAGSPEDTRRFVVGLMQLELPVAWLFVHHFRKDPTPDEVNQLSGAWAGHLDSLLLVKPTRHKNEVRLSFPKLRWVEQQRPPLVLGYVSSTQGLELLGEEGAPELVLHELVHALADGVWRTPTEVAKAAGVRRVTCEATMEGNPHLFQSTVGAEVGRPRAKVLWRAVPSDGTSWDNTEVAPPSDKLDNDDAQEASENGSDNPDSPLF
jgi:hypothetical protein